MTHHLDGSSFGDTVTLLSQGLQVNHSLGQNKQHVREGKSIGRAQLGTSMGLRLPHWEHLTQVSKKTPSSAPLQTRSSNKRSDNSDNYEAVGPLLSLFCFFRLKTAPGTGRQLHKQWLLQPPSTVRGCPGAPVHSPPQLPHIHVPGKARVHCVQRCRSR